MGGNIFFTTFAPLQIVNNVKQKILIKNDIFNYCDYRGLCRGLSVYSPLECHESKQGGRCFVDVCGLLDALHVQPRELSFGLQWARLGQSSEHHH